jgi:hypothetical protein
MTDIGIARSKQEVAMSGPEARVLLGLSHDARGRHFTIDEAGTEPGLKCRLLLESDSPQARSLEGRQLAMYCSLMFPDRSRLRLFEPAATTSAADRGTHAPAARELEKWKNSQL